MNLKLYVDNLSHLTTEAALWHLFSQVGTVVSVDLIKDRVSGRSKGYAFVIMGNAAEAEKAIEMFNGQNVDDSEIRVVSFAQRCEHRVGSNNRENGQSLRPLKRGGGKR